MILVTGAGGKAGDEAIATRLAIFRYHDSFGLVGNANVLGWLLGRAPATFADFLARHK